MHVSIWQQFSSNNSSNFVLVGRFETHSEAQKAHRVIRDAIIQISNYYNQLPEDTKHDDIIVPSDVETAVFKPYGIEVKRPIDWLFRADPEDQIISLLDQYVIVSDPYHPNFSGEPPFEELMVKLGGETFVRGGRAKANFRFQLECTAPDITTANNIYIAFHSTENDPIPWLEYFGGKQMDDPDEFWRKYQTLLKYQPLIKTHFQLSTRIKSLERNAEIHQTELTALRVELSQIEQEQKELEAILPPLTQRERLHLIHMRDQVVLRDAEIQQKGLTLKVQSWGVGMSYRGMNFGLPAIVAWLNALGAATKIEFVRLES